MSNSYEMQVAWALVDCSNVKCCVLPGPMSEAEVIEFFKY